MECRDVSVVENRGYLVDPQIRIQTVDAKCRGQESGRHDPCARAANVGRRPGQRGRKPQALFVANSQAKVRLQPEDQQQESFQSEAEPNQRDAFDGRRGKISPWLRNLVVPCGGQEDGRQNAQQAHAQCDVAPDLP